MEPNRKQSKYYKKDERQNVDYCELCKIKFGIMFYKKHKCKRCYRFVCSKCGKDKTKILGIDAEKDSAHRTCSACMKEIAEQDQFIKENKLEWGQSSIIMEQWLDKIHQNQSQIYYKYLIYFDDNSDIVNYFQECLNQIKMDVTDGRTNYSVFNYSMRQFLYQTQTNSGLDEEAIQQKICNVLKALCVAYRNQGYCQGINMIICYLLCFGNEIQVFNLFSYIIDRILPQNLYQIQDFRIHMPNCIIQEKIILKICKLQIREKYQSDISWKYQIEFLSTFIPRLIINMLVDNLQSLVLFELIDNIIKTQSYHHIENTIILACKLIKDLQFLQYNSDQIYEFIVREITQELLQQEVLSKNTNYLDNDNRKKISYKFKKDCLNKQSTLNEISIKYLKKNTTFNEDKLKELYKIFIIQVNEQYKNTQEQNQQGLSLQSIENIIQQYQNIQQFSTNLYKNQIKNIFNFFDQDKSQYLNFTEFALLINVLKETNIQKQIKFLFEIYDQNKLQYLTKDQCEILIENIIHTKNNVDLFYNKKDQFMKKFYDTLIDDRIFIEQFEDLMEDQFIQDIYEQKSS